MYIPIKKPTFVVHKFDKRCGDKANIRGRATKRRITMSRNKKDVALFVAFCIEEYGAAKKMSGEQVHDLFSKYGLVDYLSEFYEVLHTQGRQWLIEEIDEFIEIRKKKEQ